MTLEDLPERPTVDLADFMRRLEWAILEFWGGRPLGCMSGAQLSQAAELAALRCVTIDAPAIVIQGESKKEQTMLEDCT